MTPLRICQTLGPETIDRFYNLLSGKEVRAVLKAGGVSTAAPATAYTRSGRLSAWRRRFDGEFQKGNDRLALALLIEWLMRHRREMLIDYLDDLEVPHRQGETDEDFCQSRTPEQLRASAKKLLDKYPPAEVAAYLLLVGQLQDCPVFDQTPEILHALGFPKDEIAAYIEEHKNTWKPKQQGAA